uniref:Uncharacterized protein n=1 Tax=Glossina pallidipes TaxID=7398 RepID=A0A1A9ZF24_GLOPL
MMTAYIPFSNLISSAIPSFISLTASNSVRPMRRLLEISYTPPSASVCSPRVPRTCRLYLPATSSNFALLAANLGTLICTDARMVVPNHHGNPQLRGQRDRQILYRPRHREHKCRHRNHDSPNRIEYNLAKLNQSRQNIDERREDILFIFIFIFLTPVGITKELKMVLNYIS